MAGDRREGEERMQGPDERDLTGSLQRVWLHCLGGILWPSSLLRCLQIFLVLLLEAEDQKNLDSNSDTTIRPL